MAGLEDRAEEAGAGGRQGSGGVGRRRGGAGFAGTRRQLYRDVRSAGAAVLEHYSLVEWRRAEAGIQRSAGCAVVVKRSASLLTSAGREVTIHAMRELLRRVFLVDLFKGMWVTFRYQAPKNIYTEQYPQERPMVAERYRGAPRLNMNPETGESLCISCNLCALACPENLIVVGWLRDDATRRKVLTTFTYDTSRCMFCGLCEDACPTDCLELTQDFEMASYSREGAIWDRHRLEAGPTPTHYTR